MAIEACDNDGFIRDEFSLYLLRDYIRQAWFLFIARFCVYDIVWIPPLESVLKISQKYSFAYNDVTTRHEIM